MTEINPTHNNKNSLGEDLLGKERSWRLDLVYLNKKYKNTRSISEVIEYLYKYYGVYMELSVVNVDQPSLRPIIRPIFVIRYNDKGIIVIIDFIPAYSAWKECTISPELAEFLGKPPDCKSTPSEIVNQIYNYINEKYLYTIQGTGPDVFPDEKLSVILRTKEPIYYYLLQSYLHHHFLKIDSTL
jgi:hypothetical protein